jgi:SAM-dependent methyltransferase
VSLRVPAFSPHALSDIDARRHDLRAPSARNVMNARARFFEELRAVNAPRVLELGTKRSVSDRPTSHRAELLTFAPLATHVGTDWEAGLDVDVVADAHRLSERLPHASFDAFIAASVFEHFSWPWLVVLELNAVLKVGGLGFVMSHHTFPLHGFPQDYWRFSTEAWRALFCRETGWELLSADYDYPCRIVPRDAIPHWNDSAEAHLNSNAYVRKIADVPADRFRWPVLPRAAAEAWRFGRWWYQLYRPLAPLVPSTLRRWVRTRSARRRK